MSFEQLLKQMKQLKINMSLQDGKFKVFDPDKNLTPELMAALKNHKPQLMAFIEQGRGYSSVDFPYANLDNNSLNTIAKQYPQLDNLYITTPMQRGMLFHGLVDGSGASYTTQLSGDLNGQLQLDAFKQAWQSIVNRHDVYRTCFVGFDLSMVHQLVQRQAQLPFIEHDWQHLDEQAQQTQLQTLRSQDKQQGFDFAKPPLMRITLVKLGPQRHHLIWSQHHALTDGWCAPLVFGELNELYLAYCNGNTPQLPDVMPYESYIAWLKKQDENRARNFFKDKLAAFNRPTPLSIDALVNENLTKDGKLKDSNKPSLVKLELTLDKKTTAGLNRFARQNNCTANVLLQSAWSYLLHRYSGESSVLFGSTISGRPADLPGMETMVGLFINTLPMAVHLDADTRLKTLLETLQKDNASTEQFGFLALSDIHEQSAIAKGQPLFDSLLVFENFPTDSAIENAPAAAVNNPYELTMAQTEVDEHTNYAITLGAFMQECLLVKIGYRPEQFSTSAMQMVYQHLSHLLQHFARLADVTNGSDIALGDLDYLGSEQTHLSRIGVVARQKSQPFIPLAEQFESQVSHQPDNTAVICGERQYNFNQVNQKANQIAHYLIAQGIKPNDCVGLCLERSEDTLIAIMAVWKVGAAFVPMEPDWPQSRLSYLLEDAQITWLLTQKAERDNQAFASCNIACVDYDADENSQFSDFSIENPKIEGITDNTLAYVIYTSGSTGAPKGVMVTQSNAVHFIDVFSTQLEKLVVSPTSGWLMSASYAFDAALKGPLALLMGKKVVVANQNQAKDAHSLAQLLIEHQIAVFNGVPSLASLVLDMYGSQSLPPHQQQLALIVGGETLSDDINAQIIKHCQATNSKAINAYGPTESTINATYSMIDKQLPVNIGQAVPGATAYVLADDLSILPVGCIGELYIAGNGVAAGYLNRPALTDERFIDNPFDHDSFNGSKIYRTGDKVRWLQAPNGQYYLDFLGRKDLQVKVRGYRIEVGEIEAALVNCEGVSEAKVLVKTDEKRVKTLQAYICADNANKNDSKKQDNHALDNEALDNQALDIDSLEQQCFEQLHTQLPNPMIPQNIYVLPQMPLTPGGKIDNRALLEYRKPQQGAVEKTAPRTPTERQLLALWQQVLNRQDIGIDDNFFDIGGSSILSMQLMALSMQQGMMINPGLLFQYRTIAELAQQLAPDEKIPDSSQQTEQNQLLLPLNNSDSELKLFCLPPFGGMASSYALLAGKLAPCAKVFGLQAPELFADIPAQSFEQQATQFIDQMKAEQANGPYHLLGWSTGGVMAYEMARQLQIQDSQQNGQQNSQQGLIILLDSLPSEAGIKAQQQALSGAPTWYSSIKALYDKELKLDWDAIADMDYAQAFAYVLNQFMAKNLAPEGVEAIMVERYLRYIGDFAPAAFAHQSAKSTLAVNLYQVAQQPSEEKTIEFSPAYNWDKLTDNVTITPISGKHTNLLQSPHVESLAELLGKQITEQSNEQAQRVK